MHPLQRARAEDQKRGEQARICHLGPIREFGTVVSATELGKGGRAEFGNGGHGRAENAATRNESRVFSFAFSPLAGGRFLAFFAVPLSSLMAEAIVSGVGLLHGW